MQIRANPRLNKKSFLILINAVLFDKVENKDMLIRVNPCKSASKEIFLSLRSLRLCGEYFAPLRKKEIRENPRKSASKKFLYALCVSVFISFNTAYSENSTTSYFNFLSLPTAPLIQQQSPPIEKTEVPIIIDFSGGRLIGSLAPSATGTVRITNPVAFILKRNNLTTNRPTDQSDQLDQQTNFINPVKSLLRFTVSSINYSLNQQLAVDNYQITKLSNYQIAISHQPSAVLYRYPELSKPATLTLSPGDNIEIELVAQQNIVYLQIPFGEQIEITNIEFLETTQLTENCNCKQVKEMDLSFLYDNFRR